MNHILQSFSNTFTQIGRLFGPNVLGRRHGQLVLPLLLGLQPEDLRVTTPCVQPLSLMIKCQIMKMSARNVSNFRQIDHHFGRNCFFDLTNAKLAKKSTAEGPDLTLDGQGQGVGVPTINTDDSIRK